MGARMMLACCFLAVAAVGQTPPDQDNPPPTSPYVERIQRQFNFYPGGKIQVTGGIPGNIKIIGWGRASVQLDVEKIIYHLSEEQAKILSSQFPLQVRWTQTSATIRTNGPPTSLATMEANMTLYVPKDKTDLGIHILQGDLSLGNINGWIEATLGEGSIQASSLEGYFSGITQQGDLEVMMSGKHWDGLGFTAVTQNGSIRLQLPMDYSAALNLETRKGEISIQYPEQLVDGESVPLELVKQKEAQSLVATVGRGGSPLKLLTSAGDVELIGFTP
jgi:DUF4097 and DUF4098 domain-containing protein YvlB